MTAKYSPKFENLMQMSVDLPPIDVAIISPDTEEALEGAVIAAEEKHINPVLIGDLASMRNTASKLNLDISKYKCIDLPPKESILLGVKMAREDKVQAIMKGSVHTDELMEEIVNKERGLRTEMRMSHCMLVDLPTYKKLFVLTDVALNIFPNLETKKSIVQNAINFARSLSIPKPKVALLSAVENVTDRIPTTQEYAEISKLSLSGEISGGIVEGPLSFDIAASKRAAEAKKIHSEVAGDFDVLVVPNLECGNILTKALDIFAGAMSLGIILGAKVPIILTSRSASARSRAGSCVLAKFIVNKRRLD